MNSRPTFLRVLERVTARSRRDFGILEFWKGDFQLVRATRFSRLVIIFLFSLTRAAADDLTSVTVLFVVISPNPQPSPRIGNRESVTQFAQFSEYLNILYSTKHGPILNYELFYHHQVPFYNGCTTDKGNKVICYPRVKNRSQNLTTI